MDIIEKCFEYLKSKGYVEDAQNPRSSSSFRMIFNFNENEYRVIVMSMYGWSDEWKMFAEDHCYGCSVSCGHSGWKKSEDGWKEFADTLINCRRVEDHNETEKIFIEFCKNTNKVGCYMKLVPCDSSTFIHFKFGEELTDVQARRFYNYIDPKYRDHIIGIEEEDDDVKLVFEDGFEEKFNTEMKEYCDRAQAWCDKYGCD